MTEQAIEMTLAVAEAIVQRRDVTWLTYSDGTPVHPGPMQHA